MKLASYKLIAGGFYCAALVVVTFFALYCYRVASNPSAVEDQSVAASSVFGNLILASFFVAGILFWAGTIVFNRKGVAQNAKDFIRITLFSLVPVGIFLACYFTVISIIAFSNWKF